MSVERNATIRLAIEWAQSQLVLPNLDGFVSSQKAATAASREATAALQAETSASAALSAETNQIVAALQLERQATIDAATASELSTRNTIALARSSGQLERGLSGMTRGLAFAAVACGDLDAKSLGLLIGIEGLTQVARSAGMVWRGYANFVLAAEAAEVSLAVATATLAAEYLPIIAAGAALVVVAYELEQAWTADARAAKEAAEQSKKNFDDEKASAELAMEVVRRWGQVQREANEDATRAVGQYIEALEKQHQKEQELLNEASREFNMKPGERMRLNRDRGTISGGGNLSDRELSWFEQHASGTEQHSLQRIEQERLRERGGNQRFSDGRDEKYQARLEHATGAKTSLENTGRSIEQRVQSILNAIDERLREGEHQLKQQKHAAISSAAAGGPGSYYSTNAPPGAVF